MHLSDTLNKAITDFVSFKKEKIIIIKSDNYKPRLSIFFKNPHPSQVPYLLCLWNRESGQREFYCFYCFNNQFQHSSTNILNICRVPVFLEIKETWTVLSRSSGSRHESHIILSAIYFSLNIECFLLYYIVLSSWDKAS